MKKSISVIILTIVSIFVEAKPITINVPGGLISTSMYEDPSTCHKIYTFTCGTTAAACFTMEYDDGTVAIGSGGNLLPEGEYSTPLTIGITPFGQLPTGPLLLTYYDEYNSNYPNVGLVREYKFTVAQ